MATPVEISRSSRPAVYPTVLVSGRRWYSCRVAGPGCARFLADTGQMAIDALEQHEQVRHLTASHCPSCSRPSR
ncbi:hypothetical protein ABT324_12810 [Saccharopolyspora sp. NPDC000359]|uniref:hypothetical protein n=1 Tax=Saccharopolyspora sp. NPDC000359 TaxID=3154251 RepID=UPI00332154FC